MANVNLRKAITLIRHANENLAKANELLEARYGKWAWVKCAEPGIAFDLDKIARELNADVEIVPNEGNMSFTAYVTCDGVTFHEYAVPMEWAARYRGEE